MPVPGTASSILLRCEGSRRIGLGHVSRCLALAEAFETQGAPVAFAMRGDDLGQGVVGRAGHRVVSPDRPDVPEADWLAELARAEGARVVLLDTVEERLLVPDALEREGSSIRAAPTAPEASTAAWMDRAATESLRSRGILVATIDDASDRRLATDLAFYPPVPQLRGVTWTGFEGRLLVGWEWVVLRPEFAACNELVALATGPVLVTMGGSDPIGLTPIVVAALSLLDDDFGTIVALGPGFAHGEALDAALEGNSRDFELCRDVKDMAALMSRCRLAVATYGVTAFELAAAGVPAVHLCLRHDHAQSSQAFVESGLALSLGLHSEVDETDIAAAVARLLRDDAGRVAMARRARDSVDGRGAGRVASMVLETLHQRR